MANQSISQLPVATTLTGDELAVVVQNGVTKQTQVADIANAVAPGKFIDYLYFDGNSDLIVVYTDATTQNLGPIPGYIAAEIAPNGHLILTNSTGGTTDAGSVFATLSQTIVTVTNESATLPNSQRLIAGNNISLTSGPNTLTIAASGSAGSLNDAGIGLIVKDTSTSVIAREIESGSSGISVTNGDGQAGNPTIGLSGRIGDIEALTTSGLLVMQSGTDVINRVLVGTASQITVVNGDGLFGNPTVSLANNAVLPGTGSVTLPTGTTAQRPGALPGQLRFNSTLDVFEGQDNAGVWKVLALGGGVTSITLGTGLTGSPNPIVDVGTISISNTGVTADTYGSSNYIPVLTINAQGQVTSAGEIEVTPSGIGAISAVNGTANEITTSQVGTVVTVSLPNALTFTGKTVTDGTFNMTAATVGADTVTTNTATQTLTNKTISGSNNTLSNIANSSLTNSAVTYNGVTVALGGSGTITANTTNALTIGTGLTGTSFNGSAAVTITIDSTVATLTGSQTLTNKTISGSNNTLTNIGNSSLTNSSLTVGTTNIALGATSLTLGGLTTVTVTQDPVAALDLATKQYVDSVAQGLSAKAACVFTTTADILLTGLTTQVGGDWPSTLTAGDRILVKNQTLPQFNGIYIAAVGAWTRSADMNVWTEVPSSFVFIQDGSTLADTGWVTTANAAGTIDVTAMPWVQFSGAGTYTAGTGLTLAGTQFSISNTAVTAGSYGSASSVGTFTVNAQGQLTLAASTPIAIANTQVSGLGTMSTQNANSVAITGGAINGTPIGASTAAAITGTTITATTYVGISGGTF